MIAYPRFYKNVEPYLENPAAKSYLTLALTLIALIILIFFAIQPTLVTITTLQKTISEQTEVEKALKQKVSALIQAQENYKAISSDISLINSALPLDSAFKSYLASLETIISKSAVTLVGLDFKDLPLSTATVSAKTVQNANYTLIVKGDYSKVKSLIQNLENLLRATDIQEVSFSEEKESPDVTATIKARTYYFNN